MEEKLLVKRAKRGDAGAFAELYGRIYKKLYAFALYTLKNPQDAEDAVSAAVTDAFAQIKNLKKDEAFQAGCIGLWRISATGKCGNIMKRVRS